MADRRPRIHQCPQAVERARAALGSEGPNLLEELCFNRWPVFRRRRAAAVAAWVGTVGAAAVAAAAAAFVAVRFAAVRSDSACDHGVLPNRGCGVLVGGGGRSDDEGCRAVYQVDRAGPPLRRAGSEKRLALLCAC